MSLISSPRPLRTASSAGSGGFHVRELVILIALSTVLAYTTIRAGGVSHADQNFYLFALALIAIVATAWPSNARAPRLNPVYRYLFPLLPVLSPAPKSSPPPPKLPAAKCKWT